LKTIPSARRRARSEAPLTSRVREVELSTPPPVPPLILPPNADIGVEMLKMKTARTRAEQDALLLTNRIQHMQVCSTMMQGILNAVGRIGESREADGEDERACA